MHYEQNVAKNILKTVTGLKDTVKVRQDLQRRGIMRHLWLTPHPKKFGRMLKPVAPYVLTNEEFDVFANVIESLKPPSKLVSNMAQYIRKKKFEVTWLPRAYTTSHAFSPTRSFATWTENLSWELCGSVWNPSEIDAIQADVARSMALLEIHFPPSFFDIMTHLVYHLLLELDLCGLVSSRWMYPIERYMNSLNECVRNMARLEECMAEGYVRDKCLGFIKEYLQRFVVFDRWVWDADEEYGDANEVLEGDGAKYMMSAALRDLAHQYALANLSLVKPWQWWVIQCSTKPKNNCVFHTSSIQW